MPSDSVASFLDSAREARLLPPDRLAELAKDPGVPGDSLPAFAAELEARGVLTRYQSGLIAGGRSRELFFAGYPITDIAGPCSSGNVYSALHPILRSQVLLRRIRPDWLHPGGDAESFARRAQDACPITHPRLAHLLDAGVLQGEPYAVYEPVPGAPLDELVRDIGTMPGFLAAEYGRQLAEALEIVHAKGLAHGDLQPANIIIGPLVPTSRNRRDGAPILRPANDSTATLMELGLVPHRPVSAEWATEHNVPLASVAFLAPERATDAEPTAAGDIFGLGATLFFALTARFPFRGGTPSEYIVDATGHDPRPLAELRPDLPADLLQVVRQMLAKNPSERPSAAVLIERLAAFTRPRETTPVEAPASTAQSSDILGGAARPAALVPLQHANPPAEAPVEEGLLSAEEPPAEPSPMPSEEWTVSAFEGAGGSGAPLFAPEAVVSNEPVRRRPKADTAADKQRQKMWIYAGAGLWLLSIPLWIVLLSMNGCLSSGGGGGSGGGNDPPKKSYRK
jgi:eukaryotic-like serine/threonine-protein kinase